MKKLSLLFAFAAFSAISFSQTLPDTTFLPEATIGTREEPKDIGRMAPIEGTFIFSGKKTEVITLARKDAAITEKYGRQVFSKIPGAFVYDMDGTGNQLNISTRGLDPHRGWEYNFRKDGIITNTDMFGYPASHYNMPMEAVEKLELVRGTGALQYGAQFGGMINFVSKLPDSTRTVSFESISTVGSYGLLSNFNRISGKKGKFRYQAWANRKRLTGYRDNSQSTYNAEAVTIYFDPTNRIRLRAEWTHSNYIVQLPGPLNDSMFVANPKMATRSRNYYQPNIHIPSLSADYNLTDRTQLSLRVSGVFGARNSVMFDKPAIIPDTIISATLQYAERQVDIDNYHSRSGEVRVLHSYPFWGLTSNLVAGVQYLNNQTHRRQQGKGTTGMDYDLSIDPSGWGRDMHFKSQGLSVFIENNFKLTNKLSVNMGVRNESGQSLLTGRTTYYPSENFPTEVSHSFPLFGGGFQWDLKQKINLYGGFSQAYRPVLFKDLVPGSVFEISDPNMKDASGHNAELGFRGAFGPLIWDITAFELVYRNKFGTMAQTDSLGNLTILRTNTGDALTRGLEIFIQADFFPTEKLHLSLFNATSLMDANYTDGTVRSGNQNVSIEGNRVESVPKIISRTGLTVHYEKWSLSSLFSYTSETYADALNTKKPNATGSVGLTPSYGLLDFNFSYTYSEKLKILVNLNNATDESYFTKRPQFYPGPGIWPSDGRTWSVTVRLTI